jgi:ditrans,polycis-polyprenyl diphosphate synthase
MTTVSVYAFAINNFARDEAEVNALMDLAKRNLFQLASHGEVLARHSVRLRMIGRKELLPADVRSALDKVERMTETNYRATLNVCIAYASSDEIALAVQRCIDKRTTTSTNHDGRHSANSHTTPVTVEELNAEMMLVNSPPVDILIRTSDVHRFSDFMLWQCGEAQLQFTKRYWPLFGLRELIPIMLDYQQMTIRKRMESWLANSAR